MTIDQWILILSRLALGSIATFLAIILWSKTRDSAWMFIVIGVIVSYGEIVYTTLVSFGVIQEDWVNFSGISIVQIVFANLPTVFFIIAFLIMVVRRSPR